MSFAIPANESGRLEALRRYQILDTAPEAAYDEITELAAQICGCPVAVIGFVDEAQDWKKSKYGLPANFTGLPREISICSTTICAGNLLHVGDLTKDERFRDNATVTGPPLAVLLRHALGNAGRLCARHPLCRRLPAS